MEFLVAPEQRSGQFLPRGAQEGPGRDPFHQRREIITWQGLDVDTIIGHSQYLAAFLYVPIAQPLLVGQAGGNDQHRVPGQRNGAIERLGQHSLPASDVDVPVDDQLGEKRQHQVEGSHQDQHQHRQGDQAPVWAQHHQQPLHQPRVVRLTEDFVLALRSPAAVSVCHIILIGIY